MKKKVKAYDIDGTLIKSEEYIRKFFIQFQDISQEEWNKKYVGMSPIDKIKNIIPSATPEEAEKINKDFEDFIEKSVPEMVKNDKLIKQIQKEGNAIIISNRKSGIAKIICEMIGIDKYVVEYFTGCRKKEGLLEAKEKYEIEMAYDDVDEWVQRFRDNGINCEKVSL